MTVLLVIAELSLNYASEMKIFLKTIHNLVNISVFIFHKTLLFQQLNLAY